MIWNTCARTPTLHTLTQHLVCRVFHFYSCIFLFNGAMTRSPPNVEHFIMRSDVFSLFFSLKNIKVALTKGTSSKIFVRLVARTLVVLVICLFNEFICVPRCATQEEFRKCFFLLCGRLCEIIGARFCILLCRRNRFLSVENTYVTTMGLRIILLC